MSRHQACASCGSSTRRSKLISCLHAVCVSCLKQHVQHDGSLKCPKCLSQTPPATGFSLLLSLPSVPSKGGERTGAVTVCDECADEERAVARCADCNMNLCGGHAKMHPRSRATHNHQVAPLTTGEQQDPASQHLHHCALHPTQLLKQFCVQCSQLLCQFCGSQEPLHTEHEVLSIEDAALKMRRTVSSNVHSCVSDCDGVISNALCNVKEAIRALQGDTEATSKEIVSYFKLWKAAAEAREHQLLCEVDQHRTMHMALLESQVTRLEESAFHGQAVSDLFKSCLDNTEFLRMWKWLDTAVDKRRAVTENDADLCSTTLLAFSGTSPRDITERMESVGAVLDIVEDGKVSVSATNAYVTADVVVAVVGKNAVSGPRESVDRLRVSASDPEEKALETSPLHRSPSGRWEATCRPVAPGEHSVSVTVSGKHLAGSPARVYAHARPVLDGRRCHGSVSVDKETGTICKSKDVWGAVCSTQMPFQHGGTTQLRVRIERTEHCEMFICACSAPNPQLNTLHRNKAQLFGWRGTGADARCNGGQLVQPWRSGDVICLTLDHDKRTLTGCHERTGTAEVLRNVAGSFCWYVAMFRKGDKLTVL